MQEWGVASWFQFLHWLACLLGGTLCDCGPPEQCCRFWMVLWLTNIGQLQSRNTQESCGASSKATPFLPRWVWKMIRCPRSSLFPTGALSCMHSSFIECALLVLGRCVGVLKRECASCACTCRFQEAPCVCPKTPWYNVLIASTHCADVFLAHTLCGQHVVLTCAHVRKRLRALCMSSVLTRCFLMPYIHNNAGQHATPEHQHHASVHTVHLYCALTLC